MTLINESIHSTWENVQKHAESIPIPKYILYILLDQNIKSNKKNHTFLGFEIEQRGRWVIISW